MTWIIVNMSCVDLFIELVMLKISYYCYCHSKMFLLHPFVKLDIGGNLRDQEVAMLDLKTASVRIRCLENSVI